MNTTKNKPNLAAQMNEHDMPEWKGKWRNNYIYTTGLNPGKKFFDTAKEADNVARKSLNERSARLKDGTDTESMGATGAEHLHSNFLSVIQIPVSV